MITCPMCEHVYTEQQEGKDGDLGNTTGYTTTENVLFDKYNLKQSQTISLWQTHLSRRSN